MVALCLGGDRNYELALEYICFGADKNSIGIGVPRAHCHVPHTQCARASKHLCLQQQPVRADMAFEATGVRDAYLRLHEQWCHLYVA